MRKHLRIGDKVSFKLVHRKVTGLIVEDRGRIGPGGEHLWRVRVPFRDSPAMDYVLLEGEIEPVLGHAHA